MENIVLKLVGAFVNITAILFPKWSYNNSFMILSKVQRAGITEKGKAFLNQAEQIPFQLDGQSSVLYKWGTGPKNVLFLHGWMSNSQRWMPYQKNLNLQEYTMYALDAPGHGMSTTNYLNLEMYRQSINEAINRIGAIDTVICHSFSNTALTYSYLVNQQMPIKKIIAMGSPSGMDAIFEYFILKLALSKRALKILDRKINNILLVPHQQILVETLLTKAPQDKLVIHDKNDKITPFKPIEIALEKNSHINKFITTGLKHDLKSKDVYKEVSSFITKDVAVEFV